MKTSTLYVFYAFYACPRILSGTCSYVIIIHTCARMHAFACCARNHSPTPSSHAWMHNLSFHVHVPRPRSVESLLNRCSLVSLRVAQKMTEWLPTAKTIQFDAQEKPPGFYALSKIHMILHFIRMSLSIRAVSRLQVSKRA